MTRCPARNGESKEIRKRKFALDGNVDTIVESAAGVPRESTVRFPV